MVAQLVKNPPAVQETSSIPGLGRSPGGGHGNPLQCSCLENPVDSDSQTRIDCQRSLTVYSPWGLKGWTALSEISSILERKN